MRQFNCMGTAYSCTMLAAICALFGAAPFLLMRYGKRLRDVSRAASQIARQEGQSVAKVEVDLGIQICVQDDDDASKEELQGNKETVNIG